MLPLETAFYASHNTYIQLFSRFAADARYVILRCENSTVHDSTRLDSYVIGTLNAYSCSLLLTHLIFDLLGVSIRALAAAELESV